MRAHRTPEERNSLRSRTGAAASSTPTARTTLHAERSLRSVDKTIRSPPWRTDRLRFSGPSCVQGSRLGSTAPATDEPGLDRLPNSSKRIPKRYVPALVASIDEEPTKHQSFRIRCGSRVQAGGWGQFFKADRSGRAASASSSLSCARSTWIAVAIAWMRGRASRWKGGGVERGRCVQDPGGSGFIPRWRKPSVERAHDCWEWIAGH